MTINDARTTIENLRAAMTDLKTVADAAHPATAAELRSIHQRLTWDVDAIDRAIGRAPGAASDLTLAFGGGG